MQRKVGAALTAVMQREVGAALTAIRDRINQSLLSSSPTLLQHVYN
jgi:hypothetical protein